MSLKADILDVHLGKFKKNMKAQGVRFYQEISDVERRYRGSYTKNMMGDYIRGLFHESNFQYKSKS